MFLRRRTKKDSPTVSHKSTTTKQRGKKKTNEKPIDTHTNADGSQLARSWRFPLPATALQGAQQHITAQQLVSSPLLKGGLLHFSFCYFIIFIYVYIFLVRWSSMLSVPILFEKLLLFSSSLFCRSALVSPSTILLWRMCTRRHSGFLFFSLSFSLFYHWRNAVSLSLFSCRYIFISFRDSQRPYCLNFIVTI